MSSVASRSSARRTPWRTISTAFAQWFDSDYTSDGPEKMRQEPDRVDVVRCLPFIFLHLGCLGVIWTGVSSFAVWTAVALYFVRMFFVTGIYHRYFSHKTYSTSRFGQFLLAVFGGTTVQRGALWWAYHHRHHHQHSDEAEDAHSPHVHGFLWSHIGWITSRRNFPTDYSKVKDLAKFPELVFLNRFDLLVPLLFAAGIYGLGALLATFAPGLHTNGLQLLVWGFFISTTALFHGTACINSMAHLMGRRRFKTTDDSRNSFILAIITLGEGWHNNHHRYQSATRNGFYWWEMDITYYVLKALASVGFIWGLKAVPSSVLNEGEEADHRASILAAQRAALAHPEFSAFKKVVPAAAAIALATVQASSVQVPKRPERAALHRDVTERTHDIDPQA
ncbi:acyl-CoA desaturase [Horticoccus luteus]|uniref:Acyl-CoA desaturase n=1 Tax=Horticoccus luteus TaxID=2862869 RepID=A0A8F9TUG1_9BACT|nr:acyl-CoA desaturase [Horticoccus luteus]QYM79291.1 acyl-CoA desaturase [Horticoccus luteus]